MKNNILIRMIIIFCVFIIGFYIGVNRVPNIPIPVEVRENSNEYKYINPLLFYRISKGFYENEFYSLNKEIENNIKNNIQSKRANKISFYYREMETGHWTGIDEDQKYHPSSMLKVLGMMSYYRQAQEKPDFLSKQYYYISTTTAGQNYPPEKVLNPGYYSVDKLIDQMIIYSDNAVLQIFDNEDKDNAFNKAYHIFQLPFANNIDDIDGYMSPRSYSSLLRSLYNSTYLSRELSEKALTLLTKTTFNKGITNPLPKDIKVAHKFGEHSYEDEDGQIEYRELHDCGIVYYSNHPYLLCVMTQGMDFADLENIISEISKIVYNYTVDKYKDN